MIVANTSTQTGNTTPGAAWPPWLSLPIENLKALVWGLAFSRPMAKPNDPKMKRHIEREIADLRMQLAAYEAEYRELGCM